MIGSTAEVGGFSSASVIHAIFDMSLSGLWNTARVIALMACAAPIPAVKAEPRLEGRYSALPIFFEPGPPEKPAAFVSRGAEYLFLIEATGAELALCDDPSNPCKI